MSQYSHLSTPDPEWVEVGRSQFVDNPESPPVSMDVRRQQMSQWFQGQHELWDPEYPKSGLKISNLSIPVQGASIALRTYVPEGSADKGDFPLIVWFHGGGFAIGDLEFDDALLRLICVKLRVSCVNVDYRLAPEHKFPIPVDDCYRATQWAAANASSLSANLKNGFIVGGPSSGGNIAAVVALKARDDPVLKTKLTGQILQIPCICPLSAYPEKWRGELLSIEQNKDAPLLDRSAMIRTYEIVYVPPGLLTSPDVAPLLASSHKDLPPAYLQVCGMDPLRDEDFLYEKVLRENGVPTKFDVYPGQPHGFYEVGPNMTASKRWREDVLKGIEWILQLKKE